MVGQWWRFLGWGADSWRGQAAFLFAARPHLAIPERSTSVDDDGRSRGCVELKVIQTELFARLG